MKDQEWALPKKRMIGPNSFGFTVVLGLLGALPPLAIDISAPTLLVVQAQMTTTPQWVGMIITLFMIGFAAGQFTGGPLSDRHGRRPILIIGLLSYTFASVACALSTSIGFLLCCRLIQGIGAGACAVLTFAMIRDSFEGDQARAKRSYVTVVFGVAPMLAPLLGAWILAHAGWRGVYVALSSGGLILLLAVVLGISETRVPTPGPSVTALSTAYRMVLSDRRFVALACVNGLSFGAIFTYIAASPLVFMGGYGLSPTQYGEVFACTAAVLTLGAWVSGRCAQAGVSCHILLRLGLSLGAVAAAVLGLVMVTHTRTLGFVLAPLLLSLFSRGLTAPNLQHVALDPMEEHAGTAAAAIGVIQILSGALASALIAELLPTIGVAAMGMLMAALSGTALLVWYMARPTRSVH